MNDPFLIYGAYGYTGELVTRLAVERGLKPVLAGRDAEKVGALAARHDLEARIADLNDAAALRKALDGMACVLHCAGPFSRTAMPMVQTCLENGAHYLDITGEIGVFEAIAARDQEARERGVMLLPGCGFDVVPSDCLALHTARRLENPSHLILGFQALGRMSHGTALTTFENMHKGGCIRREGKLTPVPTAWRVATFDFGRGPTKAMCIPWGDVATAWHSTGVPNIEVYAAAPLGLRLGARLTRVLSWFTAIRVASEVVARPWFADFARKRIDARGPGPTDEQRARGACFLRAEARNAKGEVAVSRMKTPEGYTTTASAALALVERVLAGDIHPGFQTPAKAYGADFALSLPGVTREDLTPA